MDATLELVTEENLDTKNHGLFLKAQSAIELLNYDYAISLLHGILKEEVGFLRGREILRLAQGARVRATGKKSKSLLSGGMIKIKAKIKKDPLGALQEIEKKLDKAPGNVEANTLLFESFMALGMPDLAVFGLETVRDFNPKNIKNLHKLGDHYLTQGSSTEAAQIYDLIVEQDPADGVARKKAKDASAQATMSKGGWGAKDKSFKDLLRDKEEAENIESASRIGATREQMEAQLAELGAMYTEDPQNLDTVKKIADLYERLEDWENCASYYDYAFSISEGDGTLQRKAEDARDKIRAQKITELESQIDGGGDDIDDKKAQLEELRIASIDQQIAEAKDRIEHNPTDPQLRFDLGTHLFTAGEYREAIPHLQKAKNNPHIRIRSMLMLGRCYDQMKMFDLALGTLTEANGELFAMDNTKKEMLYNLGLIHEKMEDAGHSLECFKEIYNADYGYRDVAKRVEESYAQK
jgi:tetratricopeptide (TPR) repeat protein